MHHRDVPKSYGSGCEILCVVAFLCCKMCEKSQYVQHDDTIPAVWIDVTILKGVCQEMSKCGIPRTGYLVPGRDAPGVQPNGESSWETVAAPAVSAIIRNSLMD